MHQTLRRLGWMGLLGIATEVVLFGAVPIIDSSPVSVGVVVGQSTSLSVSAASAGAVTYQWRKFGLPLAGASTSTLTFPTVAFYDAGTYDVSVTNGDGATLSAPARIEVYAPALADRGVRASGDAIARFANQGPYLLDSKVAASLGGGFYVAGNFVSVGGAASHGMERFLSDGTVDPAFAAGVISGAVRALSVQADGKVVIVGTFQTVAGASRVRIARLNANGTLDPSLDSGTGFDSAPTSVVVQSDGKIVVAGGFARYRDLNRGGLVRLNSDGTIDPTFDAGSGFIGAVERAAVQPDGRIVAAGSFSSYNGVPRSQLTRLNADGSLDSSFPAAMSLNNTIRALALQADGKILVGGDFSVVNGNHVPHLARFNTTGSVDTTFDPTSAITGPVYSVAVRGDGRILVAGLWSRTFRIPGPGIAVLQADGSPDPSFDAGSGFDAHVLSAAFLTDGKIVATGWFASYQAIARSGLVRIAAGGGIDPSVSATLRIAGVVTSLLPQPGGKWLAGGFFDNVNGVSRPQVARLNGDWTIDPGFDAGNALNGGVVAMAAQGDGKILVGGQMGRGIARLGENGANDASFPQGSGFSGEVSAIAVQRDGKIVAVGSFSTYNHGSSSRIARLNTDGSRDVSFNVGAGFDDWARAVIVQSDGKIVVAGNFRKYQGIAVGRIARLNGDGSLDTGFRTGTGFDNDVWVLKDRIDGSIMAGGWFDHFDGARRGRLARLNSDGSLDASFAGPTTVTGALVTALDIQIDGGVVAIGEFTSFNGFERALIVRLRADGSVDPAFALAAPGLEGSNRRVVRTLAGGRLVIGGQRLDFPEGTSAGLTLLEPTNMPVVTVSPSSRTIYVGEAASIGVFAVGDQLQYTWFKNGVAVPGATTATLVFSSAQVRDSADYFAQVRNSLGVATSKTAQVVVSAPVGVVAAAAGGSHAFFIKADGSLWSMGNGADRRLLDTTTTQRAFPMRVATATAVAAGLGHTLFLKNDGTLWTAGSGEWGQTGVSGSLVGKDPMQIAQGVVRIAAGERHSLFVKTDASLWGMGDSTNGQFAYFGGGVSGSILSTSVPRSIATGVADIATGAKHSLFIKTDGSLWAMGSNARGQLGGGFSGDNFTPVQVSTGVSEIAAGAAHSVFVKTDGTLWTMGANSDGQLGDGTKTDRASGLQIANGVGNGVAAGDAHTLFVKADGTLWGMGSNLYGQLGLGVAMKSTSSPAQILSNVAAVAAARAQSYVLKRDGSLWAMGANDYGELGDGSTITRFAPVLVASGPLSAPPVPSLLSATDGSSFDEVIVSWGLVVGATSYEIWRSNMNSTAGATRLAHNLKLPSFRDTTAVAGTTYYYWTKSVVLERVSDFSQPDSGFRSVLVSPSFTTPPVSRLTTVGSTVTFSAGVVGAPAPTFQWHKNGVVIDGATNASLVFTNAALSDSAYYTVAIANRAGSTVSEKVTLLFGSNVAVTPSGLTVGSGNIRFQVTVTSNSAWSLLENVAWLSTSKSDGTPLDNLEIAVEPNLTNVDRTATILIGNISYVVTQRAGATPQRELWSLGADHSGQLGNGRILLRKSPTLIAANVASARGGIAHSLFRKTDGSVWAMGSNSSRQSGDLSVPERSIPVEVLSAGAKAIAAGGSHNLILTMDGTLSGFGSNEYGQVPGVSGAVGSPRPFASDVRTMAAGLNHTAYVKNDGSLWTTGDGTYGQLGTGDFSSRGFAVNVGQNVQSVAAGSYHTLFVDTAGKLWSTGDNTFGQLGDGTTQIRSLPTLVASDVREVVAGDAHSLFVKTDGTLWAMGDNSLGQLGDGTAIQRMSPVQVATGVQSVAAGAYHSFYIKTDGSLWASGYNGYGELGEGTTTSRASFVLVATEVKEVAAGFFHSLFVKTDATLWVMGSNGSGRLGDGVITARLAPLRLAAGVQGVWAGDAHTVFLTADGTLWGAGENFSGELGLGGIAGTSLPLPVATGVRSAAAGYSHTLFVKTDGTLWAMGLNRYGQLGDGTTTTRSAPVQIATGVQAVAAGGNHSLIIKADGTLWGMGDNRYAQLGDGTTTSRVTPVQIASGVRTAAGGYAHSLFIKIDGSLWAMGNNFYGQLGDGTGATRATPVVVATGVIQIAAGFFHSVFLKSDQTLWGFGDRAHNLLGGVTGGSFSTPALMAASVDAVAAGGYNTLFRKTDTTLWGTGYNGYYQLGSATIAPPPPVAIRLAANVEAFAAGSYHTLFVANWDLRTIGQPPFISAQPVAQSVNPGETVTLSISASGASPISYQWRRNGAAISGATAAIYSLSNASDAHSGNYDVQIANAAGATTSVAVSLVVRPVERGLVTHLAQASAGPEVLAGAFTIEGLVPKRMLIRAVGPTLTTVGVSGALADPRLLVSHASNLAADLTNDDWGLAANATEVIAVTAQLGASPLPAGSKDAALLAIFAPGSYRVRVETPGAAGTARLEIFDADAEPRLVYVGTRAAIGAGRVLAQGFTLATMPAGRSYLVRALGPSLGLTRALADPALAIFSGATPLATNDNWAGNSVLSALAHSVGAMPLSAESKDAVLNFVPASGGVYTVQVSGVGGAAGDVFIEIFEIDARRSATLPLAIVSTPENVTVNAGEPASFGVVVLGWPAGGMQWNRNGALIPGATGAAFKLDRAQVGDAGTYGVRVVNDGGADIVAHATLAVAPANNATHGIIGRGYVAGRSVTLTTTLHIVGAPASVNWNILLPDGWSLASDTSTANQKPTAGASGTLAWAWTTPPASPLTFTYTLNVPTGEMAARALTSTFLVGGVAALVVPAPLTVGPKPPFHSADTDGDYALSLFELTRVIELYNTRNGTVRTGAYRVDASNLEDGFGADPTRVTAPASALVQYHSADTRGATTGAPRDGMIDLFELTRVIELYNTRAGTVRTGRYRVQADTEDGFAAGP